MASSSTTMSSSSASRTSARATASGSAVTGTRSPTTATPTPSSTCDFNSFPPDVFPNTNYPYAYSAALQLTESWSGCCTYGSPAFYIDNCYEICIFSNYTGPVKQTYDAFTNCAFLARSNDHETGVSSGGIGLANSASVSGVAQSSATLGLVVVLASLWGML